MKTRAIRAYLKRENAKHPPVLMRLSDDQIPPPRPGALPAIEVWRSSAFLVQIYEAPGAVRLSVNRTMIDDDGRWSAEITWDELQEIKRQCGFGDFDAVEVYPKDADVVNVANMRHLWVLKDANLPFVWRPRR